MSVIKSVVHYVFNRINSVAYARWIGVTMGEGCRLIQVSFSSEPYLITLGDHVSASFVRFETHDGGVWIMRDKNPDCDIVKPITVGNNVFIGYGTLILPGVNIGDNVVIGACSVVSKDVPSDSVVAGVPVRAIKSMDEYIESCTSYIENTKQLSAAEKKVFYCEKFK